MLALGANRSCIRDLFEYGLKQRAVVGPENVFDYSLGNPSVPAPEKVNEEIIRQIRNYPSVQLHGYTSATGYEGVRKAVADDLNRRYDAGVKPQNLFFTCGAAPGLVAAIKALIEGPDSEIIALLPCFPEYRVFVESNGGKFVAVPADEEHFQVKIDLLESAVTEHTQAVIVNSPNNPSGTVYSRDTLTAIADVLTRKSRLFEHPIYLIADEPYRELVYDGVEVPFIPTIYDNTIVCYSYSKSLSLPGERIGYIYVPDKCSDSAEVFAAVAGASRACGHVCAPSLIQHVVASCTDCVPDLKSYDLNRTTLYDALTEYGYRCAKPQGAFYLWVKAPGGSAKSFSEKAKQKNLLVVPGDDFGCPGFFRLCTAVSHDMIIRSLPVFAELI